MSDRDFLRTIYQICAERGILVFHSGDSRTDMGKGYPDLTLIGRNGAMWAELKGSMGSLTTEQVLWKYRIIAAGGKWELWRPADLDSGHIEQVLSLL